MLFLDPRSNRTSAAADRPNAKPPARPITNTFFTSRPKDRLSEVTKAWKPEQMAHALRLAEEGDLSMQADLFEHMQERDGELAGYMQTRTLAPAGVKYSVLAKNDTPEAIAARDRCIEVMNGIGNVRGAFLKMADGIGKGISVLEIDWELDKTITSIRWVHTKRYRYHWQTEVLMVTPDDPMREHIPVPIARSDYKFIVHKPQLRATHPARGGVLRTVVWAFLFRNYTQKDWVTFSEVFGMPIRRGKYPAGAKAGDKAELLEALRMLGSDAYAIFDSRAEVDLLEAMDRGSGPYEALFNAMGKQMAMAILGQDQTNTQNKFGSRAQTEAGGAMVRQDFLEADCEDIQETWQTDVFYPIVGWGLDWGIARRACPILKLAYEPAQDDESNAAVDETVHLKLGLPTTFGQLATRYSKELPKGIDADTIIFFNGVIPPGGEKLKHVMVNAAPAIAAPVDPADDPNADPNDPPDPKKVKRFKRKLRAVPAQALLIAAAAGHETTPEQNELDAFIDDALPMAQRAMKAIAAPILAMIAEVANTIEDDRAALQEIERRMKTMYAELDETEFEQVLRRAMYAADLYGIAVSEARTDADA